MVANRTLHCLAAVTFCLAAQPLGAQIDEADRQARCQNNSDALARLEAVRGNYATEEQISKARTALVSIRKIEYQINNNAAEISGLQRIIEAAQSRRSPPESYSTEVSVLNSLVAANLNLTQRIIAWGASVNFHCPSDQPACSLTMPYRLATGIDAAVAQQPQYRQFLQQVAAYNSNLVALRCDQPGTFSGRTITSDSVGVPNVAGSWRGSNGIDYYLSQSGVTVNWSAPQLHETAAGSFAKGLLTMRWSGDTGTNQAGGTAISDSGGVAREIRWSNGIVFTRQ